MTPEQVHSRRWLILVVMGLCVVIGTMDNTILTVALAEIQRQLGATNSQLQWAMDAYTVVFGALLFTAGLLGDRYGRKRILMIGMTIFGVSSLLAAFASNPAELILGRAVMGIGVAVVPGGTLAIILNVFPAEERAKAIGRWSVAGGLALALGPLLAGGLLHWFWWGSVLLINVPICLVVVPLIALLVPENRSPDRKALDWVGLTLSTLGMGLLIYGIIQGGETGDWGSPQVLGSVLGGVAVLVALLFAEKRVANPGLDPALLRNSLFLTGSIALAVAMLAVMGGSYLLTFYNQQVRGFSAFQAGLLMVPVAIGTMTAANSSAKLAARLGPARVIASGLALITLSLLYFSTLDESSPLVPFVLAQAVFGFGMGLVMAAAPAMCMSVVPPEKAGAGSAVPNMMRQVGGAVGVALLGAVLAAGYRSHIASSLDGLSAPLRDEAVTSIGATTEALHEARAAGGSDAAAARRLTDPGTASGLSHTVTGAFVSAQRTAMWTAAGIGALGTVAALVWLPGPVRRPAAEAPKPKKNVSQSA
jgi:EmrB/QacA subfamily drug resistance transporter